MKVYGLGYMVYGLHMKSYKSPILVAFCSKMMAKLILVVSYMDYSLVVLFLILPSNWSNKIATMVVVYRS